MKKRLLSILLVAVMIVSLTACGGGQAPAEGGSEEGSVTEPVVWKLASDGTVESSAAYFYAKEVADLIETKSEGTIDVQLFNQGEIGDSIQQIELAQTGSVDLLVSAIGNFGGIIPESQVFSLHFLLTGDSMTDTEFLNSDNAGMQMLNDKFMDKGLKMMAWWSEGPNQWTGNKALNTLDSWKGVKMRTMASPIIVAAFKAYGANPTSIPFMEVYSALQLNTVEAQCNSSMINYGMKFYEVQEVITEAYADFNLSTFLASPSFYDKLTDDQRQLLDEVAVEMQGKGAQIVDDLNADANDKMKEAGVEFAEIDDAERAKFAEAAKDAHTAYIEEAGGDAQAIYDKLMEGLEALK